MFFISEICFGKIQILFLNPFSFPELRSLRELKKGLTDGLKGGFGGMVSYGIGFYGMYASGGIVS